MTLTDLLNILPPRQNLAIAISLSIALYALASNLAVTQMRTRHGRMAHVLGWARTARIARAAMELLRWVYYLGLPYATLVVGWNTARALGVWYLDWLTPVGAALGLAVAALVVLMWVWRPYAKTEHPHAVDESRWNRARHVVEVLYQQAHWALYRSGPILWLDEYYLGSFMGLTLVLIEGWSNPGVRASVRDTTRADAPLWTGSLAVVSTIVFIYTQNLWYCLAIHLLLDLGLRPLIGFPRVAPDIDSLPPLETPSETLE